MRILTGQKGFSLVELMITVAIIGVLAAIAVPNYMQFQRKARQSEARSTLGGLFEAETAYQSTGSGYTNNLFAMGYIPQGTLIYDCGYAAGAMVFGPTDPVNPANGGPGYASLFVDTRGACAVPNCLIPAIVGNIGAAAAAPASVSPVAGGPTFTMGCGGNIGLAAVDTWTINQGKQLINTVVGF